ncbi:unnamed protein product [Linum trigynum]|uniref:Uncharacterized protein n=1 Tax=Linum trigynum TaxID=586398 RepID=A0AAV2EWN2_9ROSI
MCFGALPSLLRQGRELGYLLASMINAIFPRCLRNQGVHCVWSPGAQQSRLPTRLEGKVCSSMPSKNALQGRRGVYRSRCGLAAASSCHPKDGHRKWKLGFILAENFVLDNMKRKKLAKIAVWRFVIPSMEDWEPEAHDQLPEPSNLMGSVTGVYPVSEAYFNGARSEVASQKTDEKNLFAGSCPVDLQLGEESRRSLISVSGEICWAAYQPRVGFRFRRIAVGGIFIKNLFSNSVGISPHLGRIPKRVKKSSSLRRTQPSVTSVIPKITGGRFDHHYKGLALWPTNLTFPLRILSTTKTVVAPSSPRRAFGTGMVLDSHQCSCSSYVTIVNPQSTGPSLALETLSCERESYPLKGSNEPELFAFSQLKFPLVSNHSSSQDNIMDHISNDQVVQFSMEEVQCSRYRAAHSLLGRVFTENRISTTELRESMIAPWLIQGRIRVVQAKHGLLEFMLPNEEAKTTDTMGYQ